MRIISGKYRGRVVRAPKNLPTRPTTDFAKEGLFNILEYNFDLSNVEVLDLFCGTGNISYEFLSRGCKKIVSVDMNNDCVRFVKKMMREYDANNSTVLRLETFSFLKKCYLTFDLIFADPPYDLKNIEDISKGVFENNLLNKGGWLVVEHSKRTDLSKMEHFLEVRKYGNVNFSIFEQN